MNVSERWQRVAPYELWEHWEHWWATYLQSLKRFCKIVIIIITSFYHYRDEPYSSTFVRVFWKLFAVGFWSFTFYQLWPSVFLFGRIITPLWNWMRREIFRQRKLNKTSWMTMTPYRTDISLVLKRNLSTANQRSSTKKLDTYLTKSTLERSSTCWNGFFSGSYRELSGAA